MPKSKSRKKQKGKSKLRTQTVKKQDKFVKDFLENYSLNEEKHNEEKAMRETIQALKNGDIKLNDNIFQGLIGGDGIQSIRLTE